MDKESKRVEMVFAIGSAVCLVLIGALAWVIDNIILALFHDWSIQLSQTFAFIITAMVVIMLLLMIVGIIYKIINS